MANEKVKNFNLTDEAQVDHGLIATWTYDKPGKTEHFVVDWEYWVGQRKKQTAAQKKKNEPGDAIYIPGSYQTITPAEAQVLNPKRYRATWTAPDNALTARCRVRPISKKYTEKKKEKSYYTSAFTGYKVADFRDDPLQTPTLSVSFDALTAKATVTVTANDADARTCEIAKNNNEKSLDSLTLTNGAVTKVYTIPAGSRWSFKARTKSTGAQAKSSWTPFSYAQAKPGVPTATKNSNKAYGADGITFSWGAVSGTTTYTVEYVADNKDFFKSNRDAVRSVSGITGTTFVQTGIEAGHTWWMRVQAVNDAGEGGWSEAVSAKLALVPDVPTTYDTDPSYKRNDTVRMRWTHNCEDDAAQTSAKVEMKLIGAGSGTTYTVSGEDMFLVKPLSNYQDGDTVTWRVQTKGQRSDWSPWSVWRQFSVFDVPTVNLEITQGGEPVGKDDGALKAFPMTLAFNASGGGSAVVGYHITFIARTAYTYESIDGIDIDVPAGTVLYQKDYATDEANFETEIGIEAGFPATAGLTAIAEVVMASGLRAESEDFEFDVDLSSDIPSPDCIVVFDDDSLTALVICACYELDENGEQTSTLYDGVTLSVYRINADESLTLIESNLPNSGGAQAIDPHASFGTCSYRVVATSTSTGMTSSSDGFDDSEHDTCVVQWDEQWDPFAEAEDSEGNAIYTYAGNRIDGIFNLNLDESGSMQAEDAEYIGRKHPVSYYGTQRGHSASYRVDFPKSDDVTLTKCRKLMDYAGDAYIREPSGLGFWAHVSSPRISRNYDSQAISFTFEAIHVDHDEHALGGEE